VASSINYSADDNLKDARAMTAMLAAIDTLPMPIVGRIHGAAISGGPGALAGANAMIARMGGLPAAEAAPLAAAAFAACRVSDEAQEGIRAFLEKRRPRWS
jgi:methylglutaconyl-CoA hydratase